MSFFCKFNRLEDYATSSISISTFILDSLNFFSIIIFQDKFKFFVLKLCWTAFQFFLSFNYSLSWFSAIRICNSQISCLCWSIAIYRIYDEIAIFIDFHHTISVLHTVLICRRKVCPFYSSICFGNFFLTNTNYFFNRSTFWRTIEFEVDSWTNMFLTTNPDFLSRHVCLWNFVSVGDFVVSVIGYNIAVVAYFDFLSFFQRKTRLIFKFANRIN